MMPEETLNPPPPGSEGAKDVLAPCRASVPMDDPDPVARLAAALGPGPFALIILFAARAADMDAILARATETFPRSEIAGCTTAGEICETGYADGHLVAVGFPAAGFAAETVLIDPVDAVDSRDVIPRLRRARQALHRRRGDFAHELAILMVDGLSGHEEQLIAALAGGLGPMPTVGGSAGDDRQLVRTHVFADGKIRTRAAVLCLLRARAPFRVFSFDATCPSRTQMVVTSADPVNRAVLRINDEPAAREYARLLDRPVDSLGPEIFATRPVLVRAGGRHHVRAIRHVGPEDSLVFFGAVAEGMVLTLSAESDLAAHLGGVMRDLRRDRTPRMVLGFDCILRRIAAESMQQTTEVSRILAENRVTGFSTYGEQIGTMHVNQTLTGIAFYGPDGTP